MSSASPDSIAPWTAARSGWGARRPAILLLLAALLPLAAPARGLETAAPRLTAAAGGGVRLDLPSRRQVIPTLPPRAALDTAAELGDGGWAPPGTGRRAVGRRGGRRGRRAAGARPASCGCERAVRVRETLPRRPRAPPSPRPARCRSGAAAAAACAPSRCR